MILLLLLASCHHGPPKYDATLFQLASGFSAKETCSCVFVMGHDEEFCREWTRVSPDVAKFTVDREKREVEAKALGMGRSVARFVDDQVGCVLLPRD